MGDITSRRMRRLQVCISKHADSVLRESGESRRARLQPMLPPVSEGPGAAQGGLLVDFSNSGGHAVLLLKAGQLPTLLDADFVLRSEELVKGEQARQQPLLSTHIVLPLSWAQCPIEGDSGASRPASCALALLDSQIWQSMRHSKLSLVLQLFLLKAESLEAATYYVGVFNEDYYVHQSYDYTLQVSC